ncbi:hypothetical protein LCGC14_2530980, partial [marine sediment metagenome]
MYLGDYTEDYATLSFKFTTRTTTGAPTTLAGTPVVKVYKANDTGTETATGVTLSVDFDGVTGLNNVLIDLSNGAFFAVAKDYGVIITTGTVGGVSVVGEVVGTFSIENRFAEVDTVKLGGSAIQQASGYIKVSAGTGTGQLSLSSGVIESDMVKIHGTNGSLGYEEEAPFDGIIVAAATFNIPAVPTSWPARNGSVPVCAATIGAVTIPAAVPNGSFAISPG